MLNFFLYEAGTFTRNMLLEPVLGLWIISLAELTEV
jgi:hypothetical protein